MTFPSISPEAISQVMSQWIQPGALLAIVTVLVTS